MLLRLLNWLVAARGATRETPTSNGRLNLPFDRRSLHIRCPAAAFRVFFPHQSARMATPKYS
jgi:hypothetical protein